MLDLDDAFQKAQEIIKDVNDNVAGILSEEDSKIQIINRLVHECLGWSYSDFKAETKHENGFSDYILNDNGKPLLLIEAKKIGVLIVGTAEKNRVRHLKISGPALKNSMSGIDQATSYAAPNGLSVAVVTDGIVWIIFKTFIPGENFKTKDAIVFPSLESVIADFSMFFDLLAKEKFKKKIYNSIFDEIHQKRLLLVQKLVSPIEESEITISQKSEIAFDLDQIFSTFFAKLTGDNNENLLFECFVESHESRIADFSLEKMTTSVLGNIVPSGKNVDDELAMLIQSNVEIESSPTESGQTIFIVGPTGAGKTTFLDRFFKRTLSKLIRDQCVLIRINCLDATGKEDTALDWMTETIIKELESEIYVNGTPDWDDLLGLYHGEYLKRSNGVDKQLYLRDKNAFKEKFGQFLDDKVEGDREGYLKRLLVDAVKNRKMLPILLIDNTDEFSSDFKQKLFQFSQALRRHIYHCLVIFPVTDKSAWAFSKTDIFGIYASRSFFLPTPSPREVFRKRIDFLKNKLNKVSSDGAAKKNYFSNKGIKISIDNINGFAHILESVFVDHDYTSKTIGELTNYNIRRTLLLSQRVMTSSVLKIEDLIKSFVAGESVTTDFTKFMDALVRGDYDIYKKGDNHEIYPIFQVDSEVRQSPLLKLRILSLLDSMRKGSRSIEEKHLQVQSIIDYFDAIGCAESAVDRALISLIEAGLIELYDTSLRQLSTDQNLAISYRGMAHLRLASRNSVFFYQMALTTAIADDEVASKISSIYKSNIESLTKIENVMDAFYNFLVNEDAKFISINVDLDQYQCQKDLFSDLKEYTHKKFDHNHDHDLVATLGYQYKEGIIKVGVIATVDWFDVSKGFGFADVSELDGRVFFHSDKLKEYDIKSIKDGDRILCDIARNSKGMYIES